jgi:hypothetical protein
MNPEVFLKRVKRGERLTEGELGIVRGALANAGIHEDQYTLIHILWKASDRRSADLIWAHVLDSDEMVRRIALQALSELVPSDQVFELALSMVQDPSKYVRMVAATAIGTLGAVLLNRAPQAGRLLLENLERCQSESSTEWEWYYEGLLELLQVPQDRRPLATRELRSADVNPEVIAAARSLAAHSQGEHAAGDPPDHR